MCKYDYIQSLSKLNKNIQKLFIKKLKLIGAEKYMGMSAQAVAKQLVLSYIRSYNKAD